MRSKIFQYLFLFTAIILLFHFFNSSKRFRSQSAQLEKQKSTVQILKDSLQNFRERIAKEDYFSLEGNPEALSHFVTLAVPNISNYIEEYVYEFNLHKGENPLIPYEGMEGKFLISRSLSNI